eukprot:TRINITY_DN33533_c0_g1_i1.p1 TRINITY_DN33533_c0_g1~~TRINITY_DN33533_c0_g1_i1.p1  ORF type:complete len:428 (+),score=179.32 TRINITY_DN33533_c0_g1_i1:59-1285(+)
MAWKDAGFSLVLFVLVAPILASWLPWWEFQGELQLGIDLGTTYSVACVCRSGNASAVVVDNDVPLVPSTAAYLPGSSAPLVGWPAADHRLTDPSNVVYAMKRIIGRLIDDPAVQEESKAVPYEITEEPRTGRAAVSLPSRPGQLVTPEEVGGEVLRKLKEAAERASGRWRYLFGFRFHTATITVPITFEGPQKERTQKAARLAGFKMVRLIEEPVAAAAAYGLDQSDEEKHVLVYDMGGGTLDVALLRLQVDTRTFLVMATSGDSRLGGEDFDRALAASVLKQHPPPSAVTATDHARLLRAVEAAKRQLSQSESATVALPWGGEAPLTRDDIESSCSELLSRALDPVHEVLSQGLVVEGEVDIVLAGGSSRLTAIRQRLEKRFGADRIHASLDADLAIALGASKAFGC